MAEGEFWLYTFFGSATSSTPLAVADDPPPSRRSRIRRRIRSYLHRSSSDPQPLKPLTAEDFVGIAHIEIISAEMKFKDRWLACLSLGERTYRTAISDQLSMSFYALSRYEYEQTYAFMPLLPACMVLLSRSVFAPLVPLIGYRAVLALDNVAFVLAVCYLYRCVLLIYYMMPVLLSTIQIYDAGLQSLSMAMVSGIQGQLLEVTVVSCSKLKDTEWISRQDPYVCLEYASMHCNTVVMESMENFVEMMVDVSEGDLHTVADEPLELDMHVKPSDNDEAACRKIVAGGIKKEICIICLTNQRHSYTHASTTSMHSPPPPPL